MTDVTVTTELDAVNTMLFAVGEAPINSLQESGAVDAVTARTTLERTRRGVLSKGYHFNTDEDFPLAVTGFSPWEIIIPANVLQADPSGSDKHLDLVIRDGRLYDRENHTFSFNGRSTVSCRVVWNLPFEALPEFARWYITVRAARVFQSGWIGDELLNAFTERDEADAMRNFRRQVLRASDRNIFNNAASARTLDRRLI